MLFFMKKFIAPAVASAFLATNVGATTLSAAQLLPQPTTSVDRVELTAQLVQLGLSQEQATERLARVSNAELEVFAQQAQSGPAGAGMAKSTVYAYVAVAIALVVYYNYK